MGVGYSVGVIVRRMKAWQLYLRTIVYIKTGIHIYRYTHGVSWVPGVSPVTRPTRFQNKKALKRYEKTEKNKKSQLSDENKAFCESCLSQHLTKNKKITKKGQLVYD